ncbi:MAG: methylenetetrahydrofolate reductase [Proteobacteria bacterium]|nr:methylenetetrahydrofolate reductase [Pseudomonadota bacterium]
MKLTEHFQQGEYVYTSELGPVKGCLRPVDGDGDSDLVREAGLAEGTVHAFNVTDNQGAVMRLGSLAASVLLKQNGFEPVFQVTCRDRNRIALQSDLLNACSLGIDNVLLLTGDYTKLGDHKSAKSVFDLDSVQLVKIAKGLNEGRDMMGHRLSRPTNLCLGAVVNPNFEPLDLQVMKMEKKIEAGAEFFQSQAVYDPKVWERFIRKAEGFGVPIMYGHVVVKSPRAARYMNEHVSGIRVPEWIEQEMARVPREQYKEKAFEITLRLVKEIGPMAQGIHFMPLGWSDIVPRVIQAAGDLKPMNRAANAA